FRAVLSTRGASLRHAYMTDPKYTVAPDSSEPIDLVTTSSESRMPLRTDLRTAGRWEDGKLVWPEGTADQVPYNDLDWELVASEGKSCTFRYQDDDVAVVKTVAATERPFELSMQLDITNK